jgi:hypothetical protein
MPINARAAVILVKVLGAVYLLAGLVSALFGPVELYVFYLFTEGGRFYYEGFGFGSFLFGFIAIQIVGYYVIAALLIPLGYGHIRLRRWARHLALTLLLCWLVLGVPVLFMIAFTVLSFKELSPRAAIALLLALATTYPLLPLLLMRLYRSRRVARALSVVPAGAERAWIEQVPIPALSLAVLLGFFAVVLHFPILFNGLFPVFGHWLTGLPGIVCLTGAIAASVFLGWGVGAQHRWAHWGSVGFLVPVTASVVLSFTATSFLDLIQLANLPAYEVDLLDGVPLQGWMLAVFFGLPLAGSVALALAVVRSSAIAKRA